MLDAGAAELATRVGQLLVRERLAPSAAVQVFATPRRLALTAQGLAASQPDTEEQVTGPSVKVAYKDGKPTPAAEAFRYFMLEQGESFIAAQFRASPAHA